MGTWTSTEGQSSTSPHRWPMQWMLQQPKDNKFLTPTDLVIWRVPAEINSAAGFVAFTEALQTHHGNLLEATCKNA